MDLHPFLGVAGEPGGKTGSTLDVGGQQMKRGGLDGEPGERFDPDVEKCHRRGEPRGGEARPLAWAVLQVVATVLQGQPVVFPLCPGDIPVEGSFLVEAVAGGIAEGNFGGLTVGVLVAVVVDELVRPLRADEGLAVPLDLTPQAAVHRAAQRDQSSSERGVAADIADHPGLDGEECSVVPPGPALQFPGSGEEFLQVRAVRGGQACSVADLAEKNANLVDGEGPRLPGQPDAGSRGQPLEGGKKRRLPVPVQARWKRRRGQSIRDGIGCRILRAGPIGEGKEQHEDDDGENRNPWPAGPHFGLPLPT